MLRSAYAHPPISIFLSFFSYALISDILATKLLWEKLGGFTRTRPPTSLLVFARLEKVYGTIESLWYHNLWYHDPMVPKESHQVPYHTGTTINHTGTIVYVTVLLYGTCTTLTVTPIRFSPKTVTPKNVPRPCSPIWDKWNGSSGQNPCPCPTCPTKI